MGDAPPTAHDQRHPYLRLRRQTGLADEVQLAGGMTADVLGGLAAVTLGVRVGELATGAAAGTRVAGPVRPMAWGES